MSATATRDYAPWEVAAAFVMSGCVIFASGLLFYFGQNTKRALLSEVDKAQEKPVKVQPVLDMDLSPARLGGKKPKLPDMWNRAPEEVRRAAVKPDPDVAAPSPSAPDDPEKIPDKDKRVADAGPEIADAETPNDDAKDETSNDAGPEPDPGDAGKPASTGEGSANGTPDGGLDDMARRIYAQRLAAKIKGGSITISGTGLSEDELKNLRASAVIQLSGTTITGYSMNPSGNAAFDAAVRGRLDAIKGTDVPPPPEDHPEFLLPSYSVTFNCSASCN